MWIVKQIDKKEAKQQHITDDKLYYRATKHGRQLGERMSLEEVIRYCEEHPTDLFAKNWLALYNSTKSLSKVEYNYNKGN